MAKHAVDVDVALAGLALRVAIEETHALALGIGAQQVLPARCLRVAFGPQQGVRLPAAQDQFVMGAAEPVEVGFGAGMGGGLLRGDVGLEQHGDFHHGLGEVGVALHVGGLFVHSPGTARRCGNFLQVDAVVFEVFPHAAKRALVGVRLQAGLSEEAALGHLLDAHGFAERPKEQQEPLVSLDLRRYGLDLLHGVSFRRRAAACDISKVCDELGKSGQTEALREMIIESVCESPFRLTRNEGVTYVRSPYR